MTDKPDDTTHDEGIIESLLLGPFIGFWKRMKGGASLGESLLIAGYKMRLRSNGDAIMNVIYEDGVVKPRAANYHSDGTYFETENGEKYSARGIGFNPRRMAGKVPLVWALRTSSEVTEPLEAPIARARKMGSFELMERPDGNQDIAVDIDPNSMDRPQSQAVADGGVANKDGTVISFREGFELFGSKVTQEDMQNQEDRGKLAALDWTDQGGVMTILKYILLFLAGAFSTQIPALVGGATSGGVGTGLPLLLGGLI